MMLEETKTASGKSAHVLIRNGMVNGTEDWEERNQEVVRRKILYTLDESQTMLSFRELSKMLLQIGY
jgi:hypothetical protein